MVRVMLAVWLVLGTGLMATLHAEERAPEPTLKLGDRAPVITIEKWVKGPALRGFDKEKVHVFEFWATWCPPCLKAMPELSKLQEKYKDKVILVGIAGSERSDERDPKKRMDLVIDGVEKFIKKMDEKAETKVGYRIAVDRGETWRDWMDASGNGGIPFSFVVDYEGKIVYMGALTENILKQVVEKKWDVKKEIERVQKLAKDREDAFKKLKPNMEKVEESIGKKDYAKALDVTLETIEIFKKFPEFTEDFTSNFMLNELSVIDIALKTKLGKKPEAEALQKSLALETKEDIYAMGAILGANALNDELRAGMDSVWLREVAKNLETFAPKFLPELKKIQAQGGAPYGIEETFVHFPLASFYLREKKYDLAVERFKLARKAEAINTPFPLYERFKKRIEDEEKVAKAGLAKK